MQYAAALLAAIVTGCDRPEPAREDVRACHRQISGNDPHKADDIIEVSDHREMLRCMARKGYAFQSKIPDCVTRMTQADNPACYARD